MPVLWLSSSSTATRGWLAPSGRRRMFWFTWNRFAGSFFLLQTCESVVVAAVSGLDPGEDDRRATFVRTDRPRQALRPRLPCSRSISRAVGDQRTYLRYGFSGGQWV